MALVGDGSGRNVGPCQHEQNNHCRVYRDPWSVRGPGHGRSSFGILPVTMPRFLACVLKSALNRSEKVLYGLRGCLPLPGTCKARRRLQMNRKTASLTIDPGAAALSTTCPSSP